MFTFIVYVFFQVDGKEVDEKIKLPEDSESDNSDKLKIVSVSPSIVSTTSDSTKGSDVAVNSQSTANSRKDEKSSTEENKAEEPEEINYREMLTG